MGNLSSVLKIIVIMCIEQNALAKYLPCDMLQSLKSSHILYMIYKVSIMINEDLPAFAKRRFT